MNNYLLGRDPPPFDVLYWNADATNMPAALHRDFMELALENKLVEAGSLDLLGTPVDLRKVTVDSYVVAGIADHITPWQSCRVDDRGDAAARREHEPWLRPEELRGPADNEKASFRTADETPEDPDRWLESAAVNPGSWWEDWMRWLGRRSGRRKAAPGALGGGGHAPLDPAPGTYVHDRLPGFDPS